MKIAIIGNGKLSKNYGRQIDTCELVIRFNKAKIKGYEKLVGTKTSILGLVGQTALSYHLEVPDLDKSIIKNIEYIYISGKKRNEDYEKAILRIKGNGTIIFTYVDYNHFINLCNIIFADFEMKKNPSTGMNILAYVIANHLTIDDGHNELQIYGFDYFESGHYFDDEKRNNSEFHDLNTERYILHYLKQFKNIKIFN